MRKNFTLIFAVLLCSLTAIAQDSPGKRPVLLMDKLVKVKPMAKAALAYQKGYDGFYTDEKLAKHYAENNYKTSNYDALANRVMKVTAVEPLAPQNVNYKIQLQDTLNKETIYFKFNEQLEKQGKYPFEVIGGLEYPDDFYCDFLQRETTEAGEQTITATVSEGLTISKIKRGKSTVYVMRARVVEQVISMLKGVTLQMENGLMISKPEASADMAVSNNDNIVYVATFELTQQEVSLLSQSKVVSGKISKFDKTYTEGEKLRQMVKCLLKQ